MTAIDHQAERPRWRSILTSIGAFWAFYVVLGTLRSLVINPPEDQWLYFWLRIAASVVSLGITVLLWGALARSAHLPLPRRILLAALLCAGAAAAFATANASLYWNTPPCEVGGAAASGIAPPASLGPLSPAVPRGCGESWWKIVADHSITGYFLMAAWSALYLTLGYAAEVGALERHAAALRTAAQAAELRALRYQINPHFLFNTLNSISALVMTGRKEDAEAMVERLATFFRASLTEDPTRDVALADEIALQKLYLEIEAKRFPDRLRTKIRVADDLAEAQVPGMILQPLIENAIRHGVARSQNETTITVSAVRAGRRLVLSVVDDAAGELVGPATGAGIGLRNVEERLAARYGADARCVVHDPAEGGFCVSLDLPLVRHEH